MDQHPNQDHPKEKSSMAWMVTFTDLVSLMLTFFVMMFAMSSVQVGKWTAMTNVLSRSTVSSQVQPKAPPSVTYNIATETRERAINLDYLAAVLKNEMAADPVMSSSRLLLQDDRLIIALPGDLLFQSGRDELSSAAKDALFRLGGVLRNIKNQVAVDGHTDPEPVTGGEFAGNWDLSLARATAVANALRRSGYTRDITAFGFADGRYAELPPLPKAERNALARRVDIVVMATGKDG